MNNTVHYGFEMKRVILYAVFGAVIIAGMAGCNGSSSKTETAPYREVVTPAAPASSEETEEDSENVTLPESYQLTVEVEPSRAGNVFPDSGVYEPGEMVIITATASKGYEFLGWSGNASGTEHEITITMDSDKVIIAEYMDITQPVIIDVALMKVRDTAADITWKTSKDTKSQIRYGRDLNDYPYTFSPDDFYASNHTAVLTDLVPRVTYHFRIVATDKIDNYTISKDVSFTTKSTHECVYSSIDSTDVFRDILCIMEYTITNDSTQVITVNRAEICDEQGRVTHTMSESTINEKAAEGKLMPDTTYYWRETFDSPYLVTDISNWQIKWYCTDIEGKNFTVTGSLSP